MQQLINTGSGDLNGDGESLRSAFNKINDNFTELYNLSNPITQGTKLSNDTGTPGQIAYDNHYLYVCTDVNIWKRTPLNPF